MEERIKMTITSVSKVVNISAAKNVAIPVTVFLVILRGFQYLEFGGVCERLLSGGTLVNGEYWQPDGCMLHEYKVSDSNTNKCLNGRRIAFVGDSRVRELFYTFVDTVATRPFKNQGKTSSVSFKEKGSDVEFYWMPEMNNQMIALYKSWMKNPDLKPKIIVLSSATHTIKRMNGSSAGLEEYRVNLTKLVSHMNNFSGTEIYWMLQEPVVEEKLHVARRAITNSLLSQYNEAALSILENEGKRVFSNITVIKSTVQVAMESIQSSPDGLHLGARTKTLDAQILLNLFCNDVVRPIDGSCCQRASLITATQVVAFAVGCLSILSASAATYLVKSKRLLVAKSPDVEKESQLKNSVNASSDFQEIASAAARMALILLYFYICDRTNIFMKSNKHYSHTQFFIPLLYILFLGLFGIDQTRDSGMLNRNQTDEWKGWMQLIILIYHITGASANIPIYLHIRLLVAMYLFMTGYGHFSYFWNKGDFCFQRLFNVLFRLNFLTILLCIVMNRTYQFYYFVPLCTFWFLVLYVFMSLYPRAFMKPVSNADVVEMKGKPTGPCTIKSPPVIMSLKLLALLASIVITFLSQKWFEAMFSWWPALYLFDQGGSVSEWWFRCRLDRFAMLHGAVFCFGYIMLKRLKMVDDSKQGCLAPMKVSLFTVTVSIGVIVMYTIWTVMCTNKVECNQVHSYASVLPITSFILIRNIPGYFRSVYSSFFAWFGKISLELFISQYHIWLAADTKGVLVVGPPTWPTANLVITTFIFVCVAHEINRLTGIFAKHCIGSPKDGNKTVFFRFAFILVVLAALGLLSHWTMPT